MRSASRFQNTIVWSRDTPYTPNVAEASTAKMLSVVKDIQPDRVDPLKPEMPAQRADTLTKTLTTACGQINDQSRHCWVDYYPYLNESITRECYHDNYRKIRSPVVAPTLPPSMSRLRIPTDHDPVDPSKSIPFVHRAASGAAEPRKYHAVDNPFPFQ